MPPARVSSCASPLSRGAAACEAPTGSLGPTVQCPVWTVDSLCWTGTPPRSGHPGPQGPRASVARRSRERYLLLWSCFGAGGGVSGGSYDRPPAFLRSRVTGCDTRGSLGRPASPSLIAVITATPSSLRREAIARPRAARIATSWSAHRRYPSRRARDRSRLDRRGQAQEPPGSVQRAGRDSDAGHGGLRRQRRAEARGDHDRTS